MNEFEQNQGENEVDPGAQAQDGDNAGDAVVERVDDEQVDSPQEDGSPESNLQTEMPDQPLPPEPVPAEPAPVEQPEDAA